MPKIGFPTRRRAERAFTLIELIVAVGISVVILSILAFIFRVSTTATRDANSRISITERLRALNIRMRQEIGGTLPINRTDPSKVPLNLAPLPNTYVITSANGQTNNVILFSTATVESGKPISVDVKYEYIPGPVGLEEKGVLVRWRDSTGPYFTDGQLPANTVGQINPNYFLGDDNWVTTGAVPTYFLGDVLMVNVRSCTFTALDIPINPPPVTDLNPRVLPSAFQLDIRFGPDVGDPDRLETARLVFPVYRGL